MSNDAAIFRTCHRICRASRGEEIATSFGLRPQLLAMTASAKRGAELGLEIGRYLAMP